MSVLHHAGQSTVSLLLQYGLILAGKKLMRFVLLCMLASCTSVLQSDNLNLESKIGKVSKQNILREEGWHVWGGSGIQSEDGLYHFFYARWPEGMEDRDRSNPKDKLFEGMKG